MPFIVPPVPILKVGSLAPGLASVRWIKGGPPAQERFRVVEFWATWCAPCRDNFPSLTQLAKRHAGRVDVVGIDVWETRHRGQKSFDFGPSVKDFVSRQGDRMGYHVGMDGADGAVAKAWLDAARSRGIPTAFVIDAKDRIAWIGNGYAAEDAVDAVLAGSKNPAHAVALVQARREAAQTRFESAARRGDLDSAIALRRTLPLDAPLDNAFRFLAARDLTKGRALAEVAIRDSKPGMWTYLELTWALLESGHRSSADAELAVRLAEEALHRADPSNESRLACLGYLAQAYARKADFARAADTATQSIALLQQEPAKNAVELKEAQRRLDAYRSGQDPDDRAPTGVRTTAGTKAP